MADEFYNQTTSLNQFLTKLGKSQLRTTNLFEIRVELPQQLRNMPDFRELFYTNTGNILTMYGESFTLPNRTIEFANAGFKGYDVPIPTVMRMEQDHTMTVRADMQGNNRRAFLAWQAWCIDPKIAVDGTGTGDVRKGLFQGNRRYEATSKLVIRLLNSDMTSAAEEYHMYGVKISSVGGLTVSNTDAGISTFDVGFKSVYWQLENPQPDNFAGSVYKSYINEVAGSDIPGTETGTMII